jgi:hypothetical protein
MVDKNPKHADSGRRASDQLIPVKLGGGKSLFQLFGSYIKLEPLKVVDPPLATHLRYRIIQKSQCENLSKTNRTSR